MSHFAARLRDAAKSWVWFVAVLAAYALCVFQQIELPGVYMDAVNPDYLAVHLLNPKHADIVAWALRGNLMFGGRAPILITLYHGSQQVWLGLPFLWLFGTSVIGLRITHALFGLAVLAALFGLLLRSRLRPWQAALACAALAVDPTFTYAFRTQSYITLAPCAWLLLAFTLLLPSPPAGPSRRSWFWSGAFLGLAVVGYFIYAFFVPVLVALVAARFGAMTEAERFATKPLRSWIAGTAVGSSAYALGLFLAARESGGLAEFLSLLTEQQSTLGVFASNLSLWERVAYAWRMTAVGSVGNAWQHAMMFGDWTPVPWSSLKVGLLVAAPYATWIVAEYNQRAGLSLRALVASPIAFALTGLIFGGRLGGHHFVALLPIFYAALAVGVSRALPTKFSNAPARSVVTVAPLLVVALVNVTGQFAEAGVLAATRGNGLFSDAINRFADDLNRAARKPSVFTPDWGLALPIVFLTHGDVPVDSIEDFGKAKHALCSGRDVALALIEGDRAVRRALWERALDWKADAVVAYRQAHGEVVFDLATFSGDARAPSCSAAVSPVACGRDCSAPAAR